MPIPYSKAQQTQSNKTKKPNKTNFNRNKPRLRDRGRVKPEVYQAAYEVAGGRCEWCGWKDGSYDPTGQKWRLEAAHGVRRRHLDETTVDDLIFLCGPSVNTNTCHNIADHTRDGRDRMVEHMKRRKLKRQEGA